MSSRKKGSVGSRGPIAASAPAVESAARPAWIRYAIAALPLLMLLWAYWPVMNAPFLFDDTNQQYTLSDAGAPLKQWVLQPSRPVLMFTYWANVQVSKTETFSYHALNLAIHALAALFVFLVLRRLVEWAGVERPLRGMLAGFGAALFLLHPLQTESVAYIAGRSEALSGTFAMACLAAFVYRQSTAISWGRTIIVLTLFGAAMLSKEQAVVVPAVLVLLDFWWNPGFKLRGIFGNWKLYGLMAAGGVAGAWMFRKLILGQGTGGSELGASAGFAIKDFTWYQYLFTQFRALWVYIASFVLPVNLNVDWEFAISRSILDHGAIIGLVGLAAAAAAAWHFRERFKLASFGYFLFLTFLLPTSSILPIKDPVADRRMYLPLIGLTLIAIDLLRRWRVDRKTLAAICSAILLAMTFATHARAVIWSDPVTLWEDSVAKSPGKSRPHFQLALTYYFAQQYDRAVPEFEKTAALAPPTFDLLLDWGLAYDAIGQPRKALEKLTQAVVTVKGATAAHDGAHAQTQVAKVFAGQRAWPQALAALDTAEKLDPTFPSI